MWHTLGMQNARFLIVLCLLSSCGKASKEQTCNDYVARLHEAREALRHVWSDRDGGDDAKWRSDLLDWKAKADAVRGFQLPAGSFFEGLDHSRGPWLHAGAAIFHDAALTRTANKCAPPDSEACRNALAALPSATTVQQHTDDIERDIRLLTPEMCKGT